MRIVIGFVAWGFFSFLSIVLLPSRPIFAQTPCCPCGGPCPMYNSRHVQTCVCCTCGALVQILSYDGKTHHGRLRLVLPTPPEEKGQHREKLINPIVNEINFTVAESGVDDELIKKALKDTATKLQLSLKFSGEIKDGLLNQKVECVGVNEHFPDRTGAIILSREAWSLYETPPTHEPDRPMQHNSADRHK